MDRVFDGLGEKLYQMPISRRQNSTDIFPLTLPFREGRSLLRGGFLRSQLAAGWVPTVDTHYRIGFQKPCVLSPNKKSARWYLQRAFHLLLLIYFFRSLRSSSTGLIVRGRTHFEGRSRSGKGSFPAVMTTIV